MVLVNLMNKEMLSLSLNPGERIWVTFYLGTARAMPREAANTYIYIKPRLFPGGVVKTMVLIILKCNQRMRN